MFRVDFWSSKHSIQCCCLRSEMFHQSHFVVKSCGELVFFFFCSADPFKQSVPIALLVHTKSRMLVTFSAQALRPHMENAGFHLNNFQWHHYAMAVASIVLTLAIWEQMRLLYARKDLPGPAWTLPLFGSIFTMVREPYDFWHTQFALGKLSWNCILGKLVVVLTANDDSRKIFENTNHDLPLHLHPAALMLLGKNNIAFLSGKVHRDARHRLLPLFTQRALNSYLAIQQKTITKHLQSWFKMSRDGEPLVMQKLIYDLNTLTSMEVFVGPYLAHEDKSTFQKCYTQLTRGFVVLPIYFPGTELYKARKARLYIVSQLEKFAAQSKVRMEDPDAEPQCLLDYWMKNTVQEIAEYKRLGNKAEPPHSSDHDIACLVLDFLFASQDASTSSLTFAVHLLCLYPDVLRRLRAENDAVIKPGEQIDGDKLVELRYTWQVMRELLRYRPPATMVPHMTKKEFKLNDGYTIPSNTLVVPSIWSSNREGFENPEAFDPDRFSVERAEDKKFDKHFMTFGAGPHYCLGQRYAMNHIMCFISILATQAEFERKSTPNMHKIKYYPTIYPDDGCVLQYIRPRQGVSA